MIKGIIGLLLLLICVNRATAQTDPTLTGMILVYTDKAEKQLKSQETAMALQTTGHVWVAAEVEKTTDVQRLYNDYLDSFRDIVCYAAQAYGFYQEVDKLVKRMDELNDVLRRYPQGAFAVALSHRRNDIYRSVLLNSIGIVNDIRQVCLSDVKMTEKQRMEIVFNIRPKLAIMSKLLLRLAKAVKYTSFGDVWDEIEGLHRIPPDKATICRNCMKSWRRKAGTGF